MARAPTPGEGDGVEAFLARCGLPPDARLDCRALARRLFPGADTITDAEPQGYCSYTLCIGHPHDAILQFRSPAHRLGAALAEAARRVYGDLAPRTRLLGRLHERSLRSCSLEEGRIVPDVPYESVVLGGDDHDGVLDTVLMTRVPGVSLAELRTSAATKSATSLQRRRQHESVVSRFAEFIAAGWNHSRPASDPAVSGLRGRVGGSIRWRLEEMSVRLPQRFGPVVRSILERLEEIVALPWVLTHGDIVPANVMVQPTPDCSGAVVVTGLLDWAEAEYLPFGVGLYGLECLLGETDDDGFSAYYPDEEELRGIFWARLEAELCGVGIGPGSRLRVVVEEAHALGVLLWHGIAFDDGKLDRVVEEGKDEAEIRRLDLFFRDKEMHRHVGDEPDGKEPIPATVDLVRRFDFREVILGI